MRKFGGSRNRNYPVFLLQKLGQSHLSGGHAAGTAEGLQRRHNAVVGAHRFRRKARHGKTDIWQKYLLGQAYHSASLQIIPVLD